MSLIDPRTPFSVQAWLPSTNQWGSIIWDWGDGADILINDQMNTSNEAQVAGAIGEKAIFSFYMKKGTGLEINDVVRRKSDNTFYRITTNARDAQAFSGGTLDLEMVMAERTEKPQQGG